MKFRLGDKVFFTNELIRKGSSVINSALDVKGAKELNKIGKLSESFNRFMEHKNKEAKVGIICGVRTIKYKGFSDYLGYDEGYNFATVETRQVYLIATGLNSFHKVLPENITIISIGELGK